jgi:hypothetical protein
MTVLDAINLTAILFGPLVAVFITRWRDNRKEDIRRRNEVLTTLMKTRSLRLSLEHVGALNAIQMEFYGKKDVIDAYKRYRDFLNRDDPDEEPHQVKRYIELRDDLFTELIHAIATDLDYRFDKKDIEKLSYGPVGWENDENAVRMIRSLAVDVLSGKQSLTVTIRPPRAARPMFPPVPPTA